jgi:hypothetical protein
VQSDHPWPDQPIPVGAAAEPHLPRRVRGGKQSLVARNGTRSTKTRVCAAIDAGADELKAKCLFSEDLDPVHPRWNVFRDAQRVDVAVRRYANRWMPYGASPGFQITDARGRRPSSYNAEREHGGRDRGGCDSSDDCRIVDPHTLVASVRECPLNSSSTPAAIITKTEELGG